MGKKGRPVAMLIIYRQASWTVSYLASSIWFSSLYISQVVVTFKTLRLLSTAARLAHLVKRRSARRDVPVADPREIRAGQPTRLKNGKTTMAVFSWSLRLYLNSADNVVRPSPSTWCGCIRLQNQVVLQCKFRFRFECTWRHYRKL